MKKKVALLLALIMVLSMLPMNVFGQPGQPIRYRTVVTQHPQRPADHMVEMEFDIRHLRNAGTSDAALRLELSRTNLAQASFAHTVVNGSSFEIHAGDTANTALTGWLSNLSLTVESGGSIARNAANGNPIWLPSGATNGVTRPATLPTGYADWAAWDTAHQNQLIGSRELLARFAFATDIPRDAEGTIVVVMPIRVNYTTVTLDAELLFNTLPSAANPFALVPLATAAQLVSTTAVAGVSILDVDARYFTEVLPLPPITIREGQLGNFTSSATGGTGAPGGGATGQVLVRLEAPAGYQWRTSPVAGISTTPYALIEGSLLNWGRAAQLPNERGGTPPQSGFYRLIPSSVVDANRVERVSFTRLNVMYVLVNTAADTNTFNAPRTFTLNNLHLVPEHGNNRMGNVNVRVSTVPHRMPLDGDLNILSTPTNYNVFLTNRTGANYRSWYTNNLHVGTRVPDGIVVEVIDDVPTVRTGYLGSDLTWLDRTTGNKRAIVGGAGQGTLAALSGTGTTFANEEQGVRTATVEIRETVPGAWGSRLGERLEFTFPHEGVRIVGAVARAGRGVGDHTNRHYIFPNANPGNVGYGNVWHGGWLVPGSVTTPWNAIVTDNIIVTEDYVTVIVPPLGANHLLGQTRAVQVTFWLSVEAGFEAKFPGDTIDVVVGGASVGLISEGNRTQTVALPEDPVSIAADLTEIHTDILSTVSQEPISDIVITVYEPHLLREGSNIDVIVVGKEANMAIGLHIYADRLVEVDGEGLVLGTASIVGAAETGTGVTGATMFRIPVSRVPNEQDNDGPITITISNVRVSGTVVPHVEYQVVVRGSAIAANHVTLGNVAGTGRFTTHPYFTPGVQYVSGILDDAPPSGTGPEVPAPPQVFRLQEGVSFRGIDQPLIWETVGNYRVGMVSLRAFAYLIGIDSDDIDWNPETQTAVIRGLSSQDVAAGVQVTQGVAMARVFEAGAWVDHDIASFAHGQGHVLSNRVSAVNRNDRLYVPFRFAANAFGYSVELIGYNLVEFR